MLRERRRLAHYKLSSRLDRKSSRGMIYENEELRLRTININAEVERGQSDIKRLRRENEQLRREIWTLRDECDRLNKRFKAKLLDRHSGCSGGGRPSSHVCDSNCNSDDSDSCDTCKGNDDECSDECCTGGSCPQLATKQPFIEFAPDTPTSPAPRTDTAKLGVNSMGAASESTPNLHQAFDHLSVVSEETMSNADLHPPVPHNEMLHIYTLDSGGSQMTLPSLVGPLTPLTPIEQVANQLNDLQAVVPPLSYFENIIQDHMGSNIGNAPSASSPISKNMRHTNGWDYKLQSPFAHRKISGDSSQPALQIANLSSSTAQQQRFKPPQLLSTFVPAAGNASSSNSTGFTVTAPSVQSQPNTSTIETVAITTTPVNAPSTLSSPKHFFAPLKPRLKLNTDLANKTTNNTNVPGVPPLSSNPTTAAVDVEENACQNCDAPDLYVHNGVASPYQRQIATATSAANAVPPPVPQRGSSSQTESVNLETILNDIQAISEDILAIQLDKRKGNDNDINKPLEQNDKNKKPYRSEMNLTLQYDGVSQATTAANKTATATQTSFGSNGGNNARCTRSLEREHTDSPSPHIPDAMVPFPDKRTYIGFDQLNNEAIIELPPSSVANMQRPPLPTVVSAPNKAHPPTPPARGYPSPLNIRCAGLARGTPVAIPEPPGGETASSAQGSTPVIVGLAPNKSQLYTAIANAAAKRAQYRSSMAHSLEGHLSAAAVAAGTDANNADAANEALSSEAARRKARRVSIVCGDSSTPDSPDPVTNPHLIRSQAQINLSGLQDAATATNSNSANTTITTTNTISPSVGSCSDLPSALVNPALRNLKQTSHSTPNSPHSVRRRSNSNTMSPHNSVADTAHPPQSLSANTSPRHTATVHHHHSNSSCSNISAAQQRKSSQDSTPGNPTELAAVEAIAGRSRCSRRHSDGTVASNAHRISGTSGHHHHHRHHHHQHSSSVLSNNLHHSHHSHQDSTSLSEHGSNSSASSRESSTSFSVRSHRRKISISSHTGGKIPWCGCWGNGCL
ncbi:PREDICTED: mucin-5AC [Rhagoletis zephyria]|uniref:mucin-5AC n=1 Tax=Rhagoletis zephyria TaxID=28612 RepID=UPI000811768F|nr:PREDICTED: mucin-5AC [Rhagoletis zephyria]